MKTIEEIENYIEEQDQNGALLVTGKWGSGKTYLIRQIEKKLNQEPKYLMAVVSLFGIEDTNTLSKKVKEAVAYAQTFNKAEKSGKGHIAKGVNIAKQLSEKAAAFGELFDFGKIKKIAKSANMLLSIDIHDFLPIEKEVYQWPYLMNEIFFIDYLKNPTYERGLAAKSKILVCFNDELLAAFLSAYKKANISEQQEMLTILKEISFRGGAVERDETDTEVTRKNLEKLENALNSEVEHTSDAVKKFYANRHLETVKQIRQKFLNTREM